MISRRALLTGGAAVLAVPRSVFSQGKKAATDEVLAQLINELQRLDDELQLPNVNQGNIARRLASNLRVMSAHLKTTKFDERLRGGLNRRIKQIGIGSFEEDVRKQAVKQKLELRGQPRAVIARLSKGDAILSAALAETARVLDASAPRLALVSGPRTRTVQGTGLSREHECEMYTRMIEFYEWLLPIMSALVPVQPELAAGVAAIILLLASLRAAKWWLGCP